MGNKNNYKLNYDTISDEYDNTFDSILNKPIIYIYHNPPIIITDVEDTGYYKEGYIKLQFKINENKKQTDIITLIGTHYNYLYEPVQYPNGKTVKPNYLLNKSITQINKRLIYKDRSYKDYYYDLFLCNGQRLFFFVHPLKILKK